MKKGTIIGFLVSLAVLAGMLLGLFRYAGDLTVELETPEILTMEYKDGTAKFSWSAVDFATSYRIYEKKPDGWKLLKSVTDDVYSFETAGLNTYGVRACYVRGDTTILSDTSEAVFEIRTPEILSVVDEEGRTTFTWSAVDFVTSYRVYSKGADGKWSLLESVAADTTTYTVEGFGQYSVRACNVSGEDTVLSDYSDAVEVAPEITELESPKIISVEKEGGRTTFTWSAVDYVTSYRVYIKGADGKWSLLESVAADTTSYTVDAEGQYSVRACRVSGGDTMLSSYSDAVKVAGE